METETHPKGPWGRSSLNTQKNTIPSLLLCQNNSHKSTTYVYTTVCTQPPLEPHECIMVKVSMSASEVPSGHLEFGLLDHVEVVESWQHTHTYTHASTHPCMNLMVFISTWLRNRMGAWKVGKTIEVPPYHAWREARPCNQQRNVSRRISREQILKRRREPMRTEHIHIRLQGADL